MGDGYHMTPDEFRRRGREVVEWIADYLEHVEELPVLAAIKPGEVRSRLPEHPPVTGESFEDVMRDVDEIIMPGITHWQSPRFFGFFAANSSGPSMLGDLLSSGLGVVGFSWATSPAATELETHVLDWLVQMLDLPDRFSSDSSGGGVIQDSASSATLCAVLAARERASDQQANRSGNPGTLIAYASSEAHSSIEKAIRIAGLGSESLRAVRVDADLAMRPEHLETLIRQDRAAGLVPAFVCATTGTTSSLAFDPIGPIGEIARANDIWLHVDAAWAGTAAICPEFRWMHAGVELADSYVFNPHKWMFTNFDCSAFFVADREALIRALSILPEYLRNDASSSGEVIDYRDWQVPLGRRFRALKLWLVIRHYGVDGIRHHVREHVRQGRAFAEWVEKDPDFELAAPVWLNLVCFRHRSGDEATERILERVNASGRAFLTHTRIGDRFVIRMNVGGALTEEHHVRETWELIKEAAKAAS
ncbi:MAG: pyridoxal-dependent decarboxylase [Acidimicrobiia bacterium]